MHLLSSKTLQVSRIGGVVENQSCRKPREGAVVRFLVDWLGVRAPFRHIRIRGNASKGRMYSLISPADTTRHKMGATWRRRAYICHIHVYLGNKNPSSQDRDDELRYRVQRIPTGSEFLFYEGGIHRTQKLNPWYETCTSITISA